MSYNPVTDFLALLRSTTSGVALSRAPGLDITLSAMARMGLCTLYVGQAAPTVNQPTTVWLQPAQPSWTAESTVFLWNATAQAYQIATPTLWSALISTSQGLTFSAPDGGVQRAVASKLADVLDAEDYGVTGDGVTDDTANMQALINAAIATGRPARFVGFPRITGAGLVINGSIDFGGYSPGLAQLSVLRPDATVNAININFASGVNLHDFQILYPVVPGQGSGITGISVTAPSGQENNGSRFKNIAMGSPDIGFLFAKASDFLIEGCSLQGYLSYGAIVSNANNPDSGDSTISNTWFISGVAGCQAAINQQSSGGLKIVGCKLLASAQQTAYGVRVSLAPGASTGTLLISATSIENFDTAISLSRQSSSGLFERVSISGVEMSAVNKGVYVPTDGAGPWLTNVNISACPIRLNGAGNPVAFSIDSTDCLLIDGCTVQSETATSQFYNIGGAVTNFTLGSNESTGTFVASTVVSQTGTAGAVNILLKGVNFNAANSDNAINIATALPPGYTKYAIASLRIFNASIALTSATFGVFSSLGGFGTALITSTACTVANVGGNAANTMQAPVFNGVSNTTAYFTFSMLQFRILVGAGAPATADVSLVIVPLE